MSLESSLQELVTYRLRQSNESLQEAETLFQASLFRGSINRAYYVMFYAVLGLAALRQINTSKHSGVIAFFDREFVKTNLMPKELSRSFHLAFQRRQENDYGELFTINGEEARQAITEAQLFLREVEKFVKSGNQS
jgi:uncharacterized protein (UPF0332 family)